MLQFCAAKWSRDPVVLPVLVEPRNDSVICGCEAGLVRVVVGAETDGVAGFIRPVCAMGSHERLRALETRIADAAIGIEHFDFGGHFGLGCAAWAIPESVGKSGTEKNKFA